MPRCSRKSPSRPSRSVLLLALVAPGAANAQAPTLEYGPHDVGFRVIEALDSTRAFRPLSDHRGVPWAETARPVQLSVWYPARVEPDARRMSAGDFRLLRLSEVDYGTQVDDARREAARAAMIASIVEAGGDTVGAARAWDARTPAVLDASPVPGPHPAVLYFTAAGVSNPLLPAYLASYGFVVASFPSNGRMTEGSLEFTPNALTLDTDVDDAGFAHMLLRRLPWVDARRLAVASFSGGSLAALLWQMRDMQASAIVALEGWERYRRGADIVSASVHFEPHRVRVPFLMIERAADEESPAYAKVPDVVGALHYSAITRVSFRDAAHSDFLSHALFGTTRAHAGIYATSANLVRLFLEAHLAGDTAAADTLASIRPSTADPFFAIARTAASQPVPTEEELYRMAETDPAAAAAAYEQATRTVGGDRLFREAVLTRAATFSTDVASRVTILEIVADAYPASVAARLALGQALATAGRRDEAIATLEAALTLADAADPALLATWRDRIEEALAGVRR